MRPLLSAPPPLRHHVIRSLLPLLLLGCSTSPDPGASTPVEVSRAATSPVQQEDRWILFQPPIDQVVSNDETLSRVLSTLPAQTSWRTHRMWRGLVDFFVEIPNEEMRTRRSRLRPRFNPSIALIASPTEFPVLPRRRVLSTILPHWELPGWLEPLLGHGLDTIPAPPPVRITADPTDIPHGAKIFHVITLVREGPPRKMKGSDERRTFEVEVRIAEIQDSQEQRCRVVIDGTREKLAPEVETAVASCAMSLVLRNDANNAEPLYGRSFGPLYTLQEPELLATVIRGVETYALFLKDPKPAKAGTLNLALHEFHTAIEHDPSYNTALAQYLYAHVFTAIRGYGHEPANTNVPHALLHARSAFETYPFSAPEYRWNHTLMLEASQEASAKQEAREYWNFVLTATAEGAGSDAPAQVQSPDVLARARLAALYRSSSNLPAAIREHAKLEGIEGLANEVRADILVESAATNLMLAALAGQLREHAATLGLRTFTIEAAQLWRPIVAALDESQPRAGTAWPQPPSDALIHACEDRTVEDCERLRDDVVSFLSAIEGLLYAKAHEGLLGAYRLYEEDLSAACESLRGQPGRVTVLPKTCATTGPTTTASDKHPRSPERRIEEYKEMMDAVSLILTKIGCHGGSEGECSEKIETLSSAAAVDSGMVASQLASTMLYQAVADDGGGLTEAPLALAAFVAFPPEAEVTAALEEKLLSMEQDSSEVRQGRSLLEYAMLWPTLADYVELARGADARRHELGVQVRKAAARRDLDVEALRVLLLNAWDDYASSPGDERSYVRVVEQIEALAARRDDKNLTDVRELKLSLPRRLEHARQTYEEWLTGELPTADTRGRRTKAAARALAMIARIHTALDAKVRGELVSLTDGFVDSALEAIDSIEPATAFPLGMAVLRVLSRERLIAGRRRHEESVLGLLAILAQSQPAELTKIARQGLRWLHRHNVDFTVRNFPLRRHTSALYYALRDERLPPCRSYARSQIEHNAERCLHRFLTHVAFNPADYSLQDDELDMTRRDAADYLAAFRAWARVSSPPANAAVAFWWLVQDDYVEFDIDMPRILGTWRFPVFRAFSRNAVRTERRSVDRRKQIAARD